jgi:hypothetical protein
MHILTYSFTLVLLVFLFGSCSPKDSEDSQVLYSDVEIADESQTENSGLPMEEPIMNGGF